MRTEWLLGIVLFIAILDSFPWSSIVLYGNFGLQRAGWSRNLFLFVYATGINQRTTHLLDCRSKQKLCELDRTGRAELTMGFLNFCLPLRGRRTTNRVTLLLPRATVGCATLG